MAEQSLITQTERLLTVRTRGGAYNAEAGGNRGTRTKFRLLTTNIDRTANRIKNDTTNSFGSPAEADDVINRLVNIGFNQFLLTNVSVAINEKVQVTQTFGDSDVTYYFGKSPITFNLSGILIDDLDNQWFNHFVNAYSHAMRGTELAKNYELLQMVLPNMEVVGSCTGFTYNQDAARDTDVQFSMQILAKEVRPIPVLVPSFMLTNGATPINFRKALGMTNFKTVTEINDLKSTASRLSLAIQDPLASSTTVNSILNSQQAGSVLDHNFIGEAAQPIPGLGGPVITSINDNGGFNDITSRTSGVDSILFKPAASGFGSDPTGSAGSVGNVGTTLVSGTTTSSLGPGFIPAGPAYQGTGNVSVAGFGSSLFSPVFGVLTSITKVVKNTTGDISKIISSFTNPVNTVLRDIQGVAAQAVGVVKLVENSVQSIVNIPGNTLNNVRTTINALTNTAGIISAAPETIAQTVKRLFTFGILSSGAAFLSKGGTAPNSKGAILRSGKPYTAASGAGFK